MFDLKNEVLLNEDLVIRWRRALHAIPEVDSDLPETEKFICDRLMEMGLAYCRYSNGGISAVIEGKAPGKTIAFRADMDALPIREETGLPFASTNGAMHACGHDAHVAMLLGAAKILSAHTDAFSGKVVLLFQPAEETTGGAKTMVEEGCLADPKVDRFISFHIGRLFKDVPNGCIGVKKDSMMASISAFYVTVHGVGGHGARPHECVDPILVSCEMIQSLQKLVSRELNPVHGAAVTVGMISGGTVENIIPEEVRFMGTVRALTQEDAAYLEKRITTMLPCIAEANRATVDVRYESFYPSTENDPEVTEFLKTCAEKVVGKQNVVDIAEPTTATEDVAYYIRAVPGSFGILGSWKAHDDGEIYPHHNAKFHLDESTFKIGTELYVQCVLDYCK